MEKIIEDRLNYNLRKERPYINFTFDDNERHLNYIMAESDDELYEEIEKKNNEMYKFYVNYSFQNIKSVVNYIMGDTDDVIMVYGNHNNVETGAYLNEHYDLKYLYNNINDGIENEHHIITGTCNKTQLLKLVYACITVEHSSVFDSIEELVQNRTKDVKNLTIITKYFFIIWSCSFQFW